jgi:hypothetical protein
MTGSIKENHHDAAKALQHKNLNFHPAAPCGCKRCNIMGFTVTNTTK